MFMKREGNDSPRGGEKGEGDEDWAIDAKDLEFTDRLGNN